MLQPKSIPCDVSVDSPTERTQESITDLLEKDGILVFNAIDSPGALLQFCQQLGTIIPHRDADHTGLTRIVAHDVPPKKAGYQAFTPFHLRLHTDGSSLPLPATLVILWCAEPALDGGQSLFVDGKYMYQLLFRHYPHVLDALITPNSAIFAGSASPLQSSILSQHANGNICIRFRYDSLGYYASPVCRVLPTFLDLLNQQTISFALAKHQGYILQNGRWLHGRTAFQGYREMYRVLVHTNPETAFGKRVTFGFLPDEF
ncbi:hypothetical protein KSF_106530 [Reticulibacter mediterranei]|uniref:TauD/TfdA-like domain-containing protein n=1 Tax=Reticulibacter mediterranei TaxID=2778369 RepID=A0A8J3J1J3_9CHLR|nr:TauD/TfdA family dioxygenase [Reticulibacter mediterranei]GHP00606.1 hypothetical protein KSF_106530 [Reticulibacter mediterranei]